MLREIDKLLYDKIFIIKLKRIYEKRVYKRLLRLIRAGGIIDPRAMRSIIYAYRLIIWSELTDDDLYEYLLAEHDQIPTTFNW